MKNENYKQLKVIFPPSYFVFQPHYWCNESTARFVCGRKWVRASVGYDNRL